MKESANELPETKKCKGFDKKNICNEPEKYRQMDYSRDKKCKGNTDKREMTHLIQCLKMHM